MKNTAPKLALVTPTAPAPKSPRLKRLASGAWSVRIRYGQDRAKRISLPASMSPTEAASRAALLAELGEPLGKLSTGDALKFLDHASRAPSDADVRAMIEMACERAAKAMQLRTTRATTFQELAEAWTSGKLAKQYQDHIKVKRSVDSDVSRLKHLYATIGHVELNAFTLDHAEHAMTKVPETARRPASRRHYAQLIRRVLELAVYPCRILSQNPLPRGFLPKLGDKLEKNWLRPSEDAQLLACPDVPLIRRALYGFCAREGTRISEALALTWEDFDLKAGTVTLARTKTNTSRSWALSPGVAAALEALRADALPTARVFPLSYSRKDAARFRADLKRAGVTRPELFKTTETRIRIRIHDLRTTFVTLALANGRTEKWVMARTGHESSQQLQGYGQRIGLATDLNLGELAPLDVALRVPASPDDPGPNPGHVTTSDSVASPDTSTMLDECAREGSNLHALRRWNLNLSQDAPLGTILHENGGGLTADDAPSRPNEHRGPTVGATTRESGALDDALAEALRTATAAGEWTSVAELARTIRERGGS